MAERIFIGVAWPYANGPLHLGHIAGAYLPADIFARYHRMRGNRVLMVSGSDQHGTPITIRAEQEHTTPEEVVRRYHAQFLDAWERIGISWDLYTSTGTENHRRWVHDVFLTLLRQGYIYRGTMEQPYCERDRRFLPDRYVEGTCPRCGYERARGDQCERCGATLNPQDLIGMRCRLCGATPVIRETEHFFLRLSAFQGRLLEWVRTREGIWRPNVYRFTLTWLQEGLRDRAITRDIEWGVPVPVEEPGWEQKRIYVWFEAVIGYLSASVEWAGLRGAPDAWRSFWQDPETRPYYFIGKDNIPFHTIIWPAMLMGYAEGKGEPYLLPYDVPANEFLSLEGQKFSTSQNWAVWLPDYLSRYEPDPLRYYLTAVMPEAGDADFSWAEFVRRNNDELVATYGNLVHRVLSLTHRNFAGRVPEPGPRTAEDEDLLARCETAVEETGRNLGLCRFRAGLQSAMALAQATNRYLDRQAPWFLVKADRERAGTVLWTALCAVRTLKTLMAPFLPFSSERLHRMLGLSGSAQAEGWAFRPAEPGTSLEPPAPLFRKLEDRVAEEEVHRLLAQRN